MKRILAAVLLATFLVPSVSYAGGWRGRHGHGYNGAAIAAGVLGGVATGIILDRVLFPPPVVYYPEPVYYPPPPPSPDPYDVGYSDGYGRGIERGRYERYERGRRRGYDDGYYDSRNR